ncbi:Cellulose synthase-like protein E6 [Acorus calamus]|uniref:Cellulose synthase-like protein E6 n=1 Tax=Acorus calamus TaxID=4465 RepID=A0AAV9CWB5_ACOCL|nr:Cellulose synthase-like protein E6 [Acorus calamus]
MGREAYVPLFETKQGRGRMAYRLFGCSILLAICSIWWYRVAYLPSVGEEGRWAWITLSAAELWFGFYWVLTQSVRWGPVYRRTFRDRLSERYEDELPTVDVFVCTADPLVEPPSMVINTALSVMAYDYPPEKLAVYLSDDGGSELTFYAFLEAARFSRHWIPFCKMYHVEPRSPAVYFAETAVSGGGGGEWPMVKRLYDEMENRIEEAVKLGRVPDEIKEQHGGFSEWRSGANSRDHQSIVQILIDGRDPKSVDIEGSQLPTLVYMAREKRPNHPHNFKAGAMNALIRVSSAISDGAIILNVDCDMYSNSSKSVRDVMCFFLDEEKGHEIAYVQFPQKFNNVTKNDIYSSSMITISEVDFHGIDGRGGPLYIGTGCFHRRESLCGKKFNDSPKVELKRWLNMNPNDNALDLQEKLKVLASCTYEANTQWGNEVGLKYGCPVEDVITGLSIQCRGWKSVYYNPKRPGFLGIAPTTLAQVILQHKRWSEGDLQIFLSRYCPFVLGHGKIPLGLQMGYCIYCLWAATSIPTLCYLIIPPLCLLKGTSVFPSVSSAWCVPFAYAFIAKYAYSAFESLQGGDTIKGWWNDTRITLIKKTTSYLFATIDTTLKLSGIDNPSFAITSKVADPEASERYESELIEFGGSFSPSFAILTILALHHLTCLVFGLKSVVFGGGVGGFEPFLMQLIMCGVLVGLNMPFYEGMFLRKDKGAMPGSVTLTSIVLVVMVCVLVLY